MKGLELSEQFFREEVYPLAKTIDEELLFHAAFGLAGAGSECFGFDDERSRDHDFTPLCCIWMKREDIQHYRLKLQQLIDGLPAVYQGFSVFPRELTPGRRGVLSVEQFYYGFLGRYEAPKTWEEWNQIPEAYLSMAVNGRVFLDEEGSFTAIRKELMAYYPEDVRLHKMAFCCTKIAQGGQYNYQRCLERGERTAARFALTEFLQHVIRLTYLLNRKYCPFYKWMHRGLTELPILGDRIKALTDRLEELQDSESVCRVIEEICETLYEELERQCGLARGNGFFLAYAEALQEQIGEEQLRSMGPWRE